MRELEVRENTFRWEGEKSISSHRKHESAIFYKSFSLDGIYFEIGDFILIRNDDSVDPEDPSHCYVGQIKNLFEIDHPVEPHRAIVQWFSRLSELPVSAQKLVDRFHEWEVFEDNRPNWSDDIDADTIFSKCVVKFLSINANCEMIDEYNGDHEIPTFFCRYKFCTCRLIPILKNLEDFSSSQNSQTNESSSKDRTPKKTTSKKEKYFATPTGTPEFPRVLIKRVDDRLLQSPNVRIIVANPEAKTIDDVAEILKKSLFLDDDKKCEKRPIIHSLSVSQNNSNKESLLISSPSKNIPNVDSSTRILRNTPQRINNLRDSEINIQVRSSPRLKKNRSCSPALFEKFSPDKSTLVRKMSVSSESSEELETIANNNLMDVLTPVKKTRTPRKSQKFSELKSDDELISNTPTSKRSCFNRMSKKSLKEGNLTNNDGNKSCIVTPSPKKVSKMAGKQLKCFDKQEPSTVSDKTSVRTPSTVSNLGRRLMQCSNNQEMAVTRSGRKVKRVDYSSQLSNVVDCEKNILTNSVKKFINANYSEDSGSEFSSNESSSSDDELVSDCSTDEKLSLSLKKSTKIPKTKPCRGQDQLLSIPKRETPLKKPQNVLEESRLRLHAAAVPKSLPCREEEYSDIYSFVKDNLCLGTGGCMYISGVPGTGKTATVHEVMRNLDDEKNNGEIPCFTFVEVNGMWMTDPYKCYVHIFKSLTGKTIASQQACNLLEKRFTGEGPKKDAVVLLVDELDRLWTRKQTVMYNIFDWPSRKNSKLIVLAIANTMDLPERLMMNRVTSRLGLSRITFQPYNFKQLQEIIMNRIQELKVFDPDAVQFVARKVAAVSGDARRALAICRHASELVERSVTSPKKKRKILIGMEHVDEVIQQMFSSPVIAFIKSSSKVAKLFLEGMLSEFRRTGSEETTLLKVSTHVVTVCKFEGLRPPSSSEISSICAKLAVSHVILVDNFQNDIHMKLRLGVDPDDINYALTGKGMSH